MIVVTFIITLVVTALISVIITSLYCKRHKSVEGDSHALTEDISSRVVIQQLMLLQGLTLQWMLIQPMELPLPSKWILIQLMLAIEHSCCVFLLFVATFGILHIRMHVHMYIVSYVYLLQT